ncbi:MAG: secondary thiamine-phosphate synthase enzyme YjbQ [Elusimicrobia bacterium]|nr:secondary thiamine-phosphate synthase enzyme YjbQ [Candidatus Liberimonas magnetica]
MHELTLKTFDRTQFIDITSKVREILKKSGVTNGLCHIFVPHTTAAITINENADPDVVSDIIQTLDNIIPQNSSYAHREGNSDAHIKAGLLGFSLNVFVKEKQLVLGTWQGIFFTEFDGPRTRKVLIEIV